MLFWNGGGERPTKTTDDRRRNGCVVLNRAAAEFQQRTGNPRAAIIPSLPLLQIVHHTKYALYLAHKLFKATPLDCRTHFAH